LKIRRLLKNIGVRKINGTQGRFCASHAETKKEMYSYEQAKRIYINRAFGSYSRYYVAHDIIAAGVAACQKTGKGSCVPIHSETMGPCLVNVHGTNNSGFPFDHTQNLAAPVNFAIDWRIVLEDFYSNDRKILFYPMTTKTCEEGTNQAKYAILVDNIWGRKSSYSANGWIFDDFSIGKMVRPTRWGTPDVANTYNVPVMGDSYWWHRSSPDPNDQPPTYDGEPPNGTGPVAMRIFCID
jgi:hypothetical protein